MRLDLTKEELSQMIFWTQANILTITNLIQADSEDDTDDEKREFKQALKTAQSIYRKLTLHQN